MQLFFTIQIYGDFSGYSDIALGTAKLFGFELLSNFKFPYFSRDLVEFWRRWHISLSSWFKDYLYIPLGGSKSTKINVVRNTFIIFIVSGFWHGASWNYIFWGCLHACGFLPSILLKRNRKSILDIVAQDRKLPNIKELLQMTSTFSFVTFAWIFFRSNNMDHAIGFIKGIVFFNLKHPGQILIFKNIYLYVLVFILIDWHFRRDERILRVGNNLFFRRFIYFLSALLIYLYLTSNPNSSFIYFQF